MKFGIDSGIPYGNVCDVTLTPDGDTLEVAFAPDPHGGPETLWFYFRVHRSQGPGPDVSRLRLRLKHSYNMLGGQGPETMRPVVRYEEGPWRRLPQGELLTYADGRVDVHWSVAVPNQSLDVAYCYPYGRDDLTTLLAETHGYWRLDTIGVSQAARPLVRLSNDYGEEDSTRPGLYLMARQHAGETPGSWVLDGFLRALADLGDDAPLTWAVPLANIDGVESGDYGKDNFPYDLNRAWGRPPMRHEVSVFQRDMARWRHRCQPMLGIDFHAPVACETCGVYVYLPDPDTDRGVHDIMRRWAAWTLDELGSTYAADPFDRVARYPSRWETPRFRDYGWLQLGLPCITFETPYAMAGEKVLTQEDYREIGRRLVAGTMRGIEAILE
ncbi:MAG: hypothetical protein ACP5HG_03645 [Anaerolineae bacterium]